MNFALISGMLDPPGVEQAMLLRRLLPGVEWPDAVVGDDGSLRWASSQPACEVTWKPGSTGSWGLTASHGLDWSLVWWGSTPRKAADALAKWQPQYANIIKRLLEAA